MKKLSLFLIISFLSLSCLSILFHPVTAGEETRTIINENEVIPEKHLLLNKDGSYGGSLDIELYGEGAPLNGELDHIDTEYYKINDYYNAYSTATRTIVNSFSPYQQTTANSSGIACAVMALNNFGFDMRINSEERLYHKYEIINNQSIKENGVSSEGLKNLFNSLGLFAYIDNYKGGSSISNLTKWVRNALTNDYLPMFPLWLDNGYQWYLCIGVDDNGNERDSDDTFILANPFDAFDHYQDGYTAITGKALIRWFIDIENDIYIKEGATKESYALYYQTVMVKAPKKLKTELGEETLNQNNIIPDIHLLANADGTYGGKLKDENGNTPWGGSVSFTSRSDDTRSVLKSVYFRFNDYYTWDDEGTRLFLNHYRAKLQTTASTCGICSSLSALVYLGIPYDEANHDLDDYTCTGEYKLMKQIEALCNITVYNRGVANYELHKLLPKYGMKVNHSAGYNMYEYLLGNKQKVYPTYLNMANQVKEDLTLDQPFLIGWTVSGGHWQVVIGYDDMGTESPYDDVMVLADSSDSVDHLADGYNVHSGMLVYNHWYNGSFHWNQQGLSLGKLPEQTE